MTPPYYRELGIEVELAVLVGAAELEDGLRGGETAIADDVWDAAPSLAGWDVVIAHGPLPVPVSVLRLSIDASQPDAALWERLRPLVGRVAVPSASYGPPGVEAVELPEAIDPLSPRCADLPVALAGSLLRARGVDTARPCCCMLRAFDSWQDPQDVLDGFAMAKTELPQLQLVLAGDEAWGPLREVFDYAQEQEDVVLVNHASDVELNALGQIARAALESSLAPGPHVPTLETLWKRTPVIAAGRRGAAHPVRDGRDGYLVDSPEQAAERLVELVRDPSLAIELGDSGQDLVREKHLVTGRLADELELVSAARAATLQSP